MCLLSPVLGHGPLGHRLAAPCLHLPIPEGVCIPHPSASTGWLRCIPFPFTLFSCLRLFGICSSFDPLQWSILWQGEMDASTLPEFESWAPPQGLLWNSVCRCPFHWAFGINVAAVHAHVFIPSTCEPCSVTRVLQPESCHLPSAPFPAAVCLLGRWPLGLHWQLLLNFLLLQVQLVFSHPVSETRPPTTVSVLCPGGAPCVVHDPS